MDRGAIREPASGSCESGHATEAVFVKNMVLMTNLIEADVERAALEWLCGLGWQVLHGPDIAPDMPNAERDDYGQVVLDRKRNHL